VAEFETASTLEPAGQPEAEDTRGMPTGIDRTDSYADTMGRSAQTDAGRMGEPSDKLADSGWLCDANVVNIAEEKENQGWDKLARPSGADPLPVSTSGTRGAADMRAWPQDADQRVDRGSGYGDSV
jgi:hypothetical protein